MVNVMVKNEDPIQKELRSRMRLFRQAVKSEDKKNELYDGIEGSEMTIIYDIYLPTKNSKKFVDGLFIYTDEEGKIKSAEYYLKDSEGTKVTGLPEKDFNVVKELFQDLLSVEVEYIPTD